MNNHPRMPLYTLLGPLLLVVEAFRGAGKRYCVSCGETDFPREDYPNHRLYCRRCGHEFRTN